MATTLERMKEKTAEIGSINTNGHKSKPDTIKVYVQGQIKPADVGSRAGDSLPAGLDADLVVRRGNGKNIEIEPVGKDYKVRKEDSLIITPRGVAGL